MSTSTQTPGSSGIPASAETPDSTQTAARIDAAAVARMGPQIRKELVRHAKSGTFSATTTLKQVFTELFGNERSRRDEVQYLMYAAPIARRIAIGLADAAERVANSDVSIQDVREWLGWMDCFDPLCARMVDLHYVAGLSTRETAAALDVPLRTVIRELRFAKEWLQTKL